MNKRLEHYMSKNYKAVILKDEIETGYCAFHRELKGCITCGDTIENALRNLTDAKEEWLAAAIEDDIDIPEPDQDENDPDSFTGSFDLQIEPGLHLKAVLKAYEKGVSLNEFVEESIKQAVNSNE